MYFLHPVFFFKFIFNAKVIVSYEVNFIENLKKISRHKVPYILFLMSA